MISKIIKSMCLLFTVVFFCACGKRSGKSDAVNTDGIQEIEVTSADLHNGVWDSIITNTGNGKNQSPELTWTEVQETGEYAIYMIDPDGENWLHWKAHGVTITNLDAGASIPESEYIGPYPPSGTHRYTVIIYALKSVPDSIPGNFDGPDNDIERIEAGLDTANGQRGNIIGKGTLTGTYKAGT